MDWVGSSDRQIVQAVGSEGDGLCHAEHELRLAEAPCSLLQPEVLVDCLEQPHGLGSLTQQNRPGVAGDVEIRGANVDRARVSRYPHLGDASCSRRCCVWTSPSSLHRRHFRWICRRDLPRYQWISVANRCEPQDDAVGPERSAADVPEDVQLARRVPQGALLGRSVPATAPHSVSAARCRGPRLRGHASLAAESPPPAKPSTPARTSSAAGAAKQKHEEKNPHHADNHPKNRVVHMPLPPLRWLNLVEAFFLSLPELVEDAHPTWSHEESNDDEGDPGEDPSPEESHDAGNHKHGSDDPQDGVSVAAALRREHPENSEHVASPHPLATL